MSRDSGSSGYRKLPGRKTGLYRRISLWLGPDHLLAVESNVYQEQYQRYYFKDIQALTLRRTAAGKWLNGALSLLMVLLAIMLFNAYKDHDQAALWVWSIPLGALLLGLLVNVFKGPTCHCQIQTPISMNSLPSLNRLPAARKVINRLRPLIEQTQGPLTRERIETSARDRAGAEPVPPAQASPQAARGNANAVLPHYRGGLHWWLFGLCLLGALYCIAYLFVNGLPMFLLGLFCLLGLLLLTIIVMARQHKSRLPKELGVVCWCLLGVLLTGSMVGYYAMMLSVLSSGQVNHMFNQWTMVTAFAQVKPLDSPFFAGLLIVCALSLLLAGLFGSLVLANWQRRNRATLPQPKGRP